MTIKVGNPDEDFNDNIPELNMNSTRIHEQARNTTPPTGIRYKYDSLDPGKHTRFPRDCNGRDAVPICLEESKNVPSQTIRPI